MSDHTDPGHATGPHERTSRSNTRVGDSGAPVGSPLTIVLAVIAVAVGFLIFRSISDDGDALGPGALSDGATTLPVTIAGQTTIGGTAAGPTTPTTAAAQVTEGASVVVVNASEEGGSAAALTAELADEGYQMIGEGVSDNDNVLAEILEETVVYFAGPGGPEAVARSVAADLGNVPVSAAPSDIADQISSEDSPGEATVYVMLGIDLVGKTLPLPQAPAAPTVAPTTTTG
jgi:hypothetical protein